MLTEIGQSRPIPPYEAMKAITIVENKETLINILDLSPRIVSLMSRQRMVYEGIDQPRLLLRQTISDKLLNILNQINSNCGLGIFDAYRPNKVQQLWYEAELAKIQADHQSWPQEKCIDEVKRWLSPAQTDPTLPPSPHSTGGAVDITIVQLENPIITIDMGSNHGEWSSRSWTNSQEISSAARDNRIKLQQLMASVGMVNYPGEWWHYSWGDSFWAVATRAKQAVYGRIEL